MDGSTATNAHKTYGWPVEPLRDEHDSRESDQWPLCKIREHACAKPRQFTGNLFPTESSPEAFFVQRSVHCARIEAQDPAWAGLGQHLLRPRNGVTCCKKTLRRSPKPAQNLKHDSAGDGPLLQHSMHGADADRNGRSALEGSVDFRGQFNPGQRSGTPLRIHGGVEGLHVKFAKLRHHAPNVAQIFSAPDPSRRTSFRLWSETRTSHRRAGRHRRRAA
jgi:hypothetical protein